MNPDYNLAVAESIRVLKDYSYNEIPIKLNKILKALKRTIKTCSYTDFSRQTGLSIEEICDFFESELGACAYDHKCERYVIYYNDTKNNLGLTRFTIAHELGHIFLKHHIKANTDILNRHGISAGVYDRFEKEANCFARNFLAPQPLVKCVTDTSKSWAINEIMDAFTISYEAAKTRKNLLIVDRYRINEAHKAYFSQYKINYGYYCLTCGNAEVEPLKYCKICGDEESIFIKGVDRLFYSNGIEIDENMRVVKCPRCKNEDFSENAEYCKICGTKVYNYCLGKEIYDNHGNFVDTEYHKNPSNARFCETCGNKTVYFEEKLLSSWEEYQREVKDMLGFPEDDDLPF